MSSVCSENRKPIVRLRLHSSSAGSLSHALIARDSVILADASSVQPSEEIHSIANDLLQKEPTIGWGTWSSRRTKMKGLRFHIYELMQGDSPQIWTFACVYDSTSIKKKTAQLFLQKIVVLTELQRYCEDTWRTGEERSCQDAWSPFLRQQMEHAAGSSSSSGVNSLDVTDQIIKMNRIVQKEVDKRKKGTTSPSKDTDEFVDYDTTISTSLSDDDSHEVLELSSDDAEDESLEDPSLASGSVMELFAGEKRGINNRSERNHPQDEPKSFDLDGTLSGDESQEEGDEYDNYYWEKRASSLVMSMKLASLQNRERLETLKKTHHHITGWKESDEILMAERDQAWNHQVACLMEQLAERDAEIVQLKRMLQQRQPEMAASCKDNKSTKQDIQKS